MSRIGKLPIKVPTNVEINWNGSKLIVKGQFGTLQNEIPEVLEIKKSDDILKVGLKNKTRTTTALHGLYRTLISNMVIGVSQQFKITLKLQPRTLCLRHVSNRLFDVGCRARIGYFVGTATLPPACRAGYCL